MATRIYVGDFQPGSTITGCFALKWKQLDQFRGKPGQYLSLGLFDGRQDVRAVMWDGGPEVFPHLDTDVVWLEGSLNSFRGNLQIVINRIRPAQRGEYDPRDFLPTAPIDIEAVFASLLEVVAGIENPHLRALLEHFFHDPNWARDFREAPAAKGIHHAYLGGLLEHTWHVVQICQQACQLYPALDRDLLITGAILHDIGKIEEYTYRVTIDHSDAGRLLGHIVLGDERVCQAMETVEDFPPGLALRLRHLLISHHGEYEWGSPKRPKTAEACVLHHADNMDAKAHQFLALQETDEQGWTPYNKSLGRMIFLGRDDR